MTYGRREPDRPAEKTLKTFGYAFPETAASAAAKAGAVPGRRDRGAVRIDAAKAATAGADVGATVRSPDPDRAAWRTLPRGLCKYLPMGRRSAECHEY